MDWNVQEKSRRTGVLNERIRKCGDPAGGICAGAGKGKDPAAETLDCCAVLLRGGRSRRMGRDKALLPWGDGTFLQAVAACLEIFPEKYLSVAWEESAGRSAGSGQEKGSAQRYGLSEDWILLPDRLPECGPMGGIWTALLTCRSPWALIASCDLPALGRPLLQQLLAGRGEDADLLCPVTPDGRMHLTCALYRKTLAPQIGERIREGDFRLRSLPDRCRTKRISITDPAMIRMLTNVNTEADLALLHASGPDPHSDPDPESGSRLGIQTRDPDSGPRLGSLQVRMIRNEEEADLCGCVRCKKQRKDDPDGEDSP